tara:strand:+ start:5971 stop:6192 length:222 start_codon:yes stop_codon:yes gene_type:complete
MDKKISHKQNLKDKVLSGRSVDYKGLTICRINDFYPLMHKKIRYQVHSHFFSKLYENIDEALDKFFDIRRRIK